MANGTVKSWKLSCPRCGEQTALCLDLNDMAGELDCRGCDSTFTVNQAIAELTASLARWRAVAKWIALAGECMAAPSTTE